MKKNIKLFLLLFLIAIIILTILIFKKVFIKKEVVEVSALKSEILISDGLGMPFRFSYIEGYLIVADIAPFKSNKLLIFSAIDGSLIRSTGGNGRGPGELISPVSINRDVNGLDRFWVYDGTLRRLTLFNIKLEQNVDSAYILNVTDGGSYDPVWLNDSVIVSPGFMLDSGRVGFYNNKGRLIRQTGVVPDDNKESILKIRQQVYQCELKIRPDRSKFVLANLLADKLEIYDSSGMDCKIVTGPNKIAPKYEVVKGTRFISDDTSPICYTSISVTDKYIFALFSGKTRKEFGENGASYSRYVHIYDWDGNLVRQLTLDKDVLTITVDSNCNKLYAVQHDPDVAILSYKLPPL